MGQDWVSVSMIHTEVRVLFWLSVAFRYCALFYMCFYYEQQLEAKLNAARKGSWQGTLMGGV